MSDELDYYDVQQEFLYKNSITPQRVQEHLYNVVYNRNWKNYLNSIEWDGLWLRHDTEEEKIEKKIKRERELHPFKKFI
jgi:hypothetical protein